MKHLGYKLVVRTIAGIYASGGTPSALSVTVALSSRFEEEQTEELFGGITLAAKYNTKIRYFDLTSSLTGMTLACTAWGFRGKRYARREETLRNRSYMCNRRSGSSLYRIADS
ncbi:MAG: AIR synthase related protein [Marinilabiliales bacterium]|nr:AIR synthase related protein [Marinilabiliales bacterium]